MTLNFAYTDQPGSLITSRHAFRSSWNFQKSKQVIYTSELGTFQAVKIFFPRLVYETSWKKKKKSRMFYFLFLMLSSSSIKELLHKPAEIQWNITETLPGKLRRKISWALSFEILPPENTKMWEIAIFGVLWGPGNLCVTPWFLSLTLNIVVKTVLPSN